MIDWKILAVIVVGVVVGRLVSILMSGPPGDVDD